MIVKLVAAGSLALAGLTMAAPAASAEPTSVGGTRVSATQSEGDVQAQVATQFVVSNTTDQVLTIESHWVTLATWGNEPKDGTKLYPGQKLNFSVNPKGTEGKDGAVVYMRVGESKSFVVAMARPSFGASFKDSRVDYESYRESPLDFGDGAFAVTPSTSGWNTGVLTVKNTTPRSHTLTAAQAGAQLEALKEMCAQDSSADCTFVANTYQRGLAAAKRVGGVLQNDGVTEVTRSYQWSSTTTTASEWGVQVGLSTKVLGLVESSFTSHFKETVTKSAQVSDSLGVPVKPGWSSWVTYQAPVFKTTGDFTVKIGGNTWKITDVTFDIPQPDEQKTGTLAVKQLPTGDPGVPMGTLVQKIG